MTIMDAFHAEEIGKSIMLNVLKQRPSWKIEKVPQIFEYLRVHNYQRSARGESITHLPLCYAVL